MKWFIDFEYHKIEGHAGFKRTVQLLNTLYNAQRKYEDLLNGLLSHDKIAVKWAISEVSYQIYNYQNFDAMDNSIEVIINRILLKTTGGLASALGTLSDWIFPFKNEQYFRKHQLMLERILELYQSDQPVEFDAPYLEEKLIQIALALQLWKSRSDIVPQYIKLGSESRFNSPRFKFDSLVND